MTNTVLSIPNYGELIESWSGYALQRSGLVTPLIVRGEDSTGHTNIACSGLIRLWLRPYWSSASLPNGTGPGVNGRLIELAAVDNKQSAVVFSLQVSPDGSTLSLIGQSDTDAVVLLKVSIDWQAGDWHLVALDYGPKGTALFLDGKLAAEGPGTLAIPPNVAQLVIGSTLAGTETPESEFDEIFLLGRFDENSFLGRYFLRRWPTALAVAVHYTFASGQVARGPISAEEDAAWREMVAKMRAEREAAGEGGNSAMASIFSTNDLWLEIIQMTNTTADLLIHPPWTATNGVYDLYFRTNLNLNPTSTFSLQWSRIQRSTPGQTNLVVTNLLSDQGFFMIGPLTNAIRPGFDQEFLERNDDNVDDNGQELTNLLATIGFSINFFGTSYTNLYVNNNGNVTFDNALALKQAHYDRRRRASNKLSKISSRNFLIRLPACRDSPTNRIGAAICVRGYLFDPIFRPAQRHLFCGSATQPILWLLYSTSTNRWSLSQVAKKSANQPLYPSTR